MITVALIGGSREEHRAFYRRKLAEHSCMLAEYAPEVDEVACLLRNNNWKALGLLYQKIARKAQSEGCDAVMLCSDILHGAAEAVCRCISVPLIDFREQVGAEITRRGVNRVFFDASSYARHHYHYLFHNHMDFHMCFADPKVFPKERDCMSYQYCGEEASYGAEGVLDPAVIHLDMAAEFIRKGRKK